MNQKTYSCCLVYCSQLAFMALRADVTEYSVAFYEDLSNIGDQTSCVSKCISFFDPSVYYCIVLGVLTDCSKVTWTKHFRNWFDSQMIMRNNPLFFDQGQLLYYFFLCIIDQGGCSWPIYSYDSICLISQFASYQICWSSLPNREDASNSKISINNRASIQGIIGNDIALSFTNFEVLRSFLA